MYNALPQLTITVSGRYPHHHHRRRRRRHRRQK